MHKRLVSQQPRTAAINGNVVMEIEFYELCGSRLSRRHQVISQLLPSSIHPSVSGRHDDGLRQTDRSHLVADSSASSYYRAQKRSAQSALI